MAASHVRVLLISGSTRAASTNTAMLRTVRAVAPDGVRAEVFDGMVRLPYFDPDDDTDDLHPAVAELRREIGAADAVVFCTPEYAGALPGSFKNLLDWTVGGGEIYGKPVAYINVSASPTGAANAHRSLVTVLGYVGADLVEAASRHIPVPRGSVGADGLVADEGIRAGAADVLANLAKYVADRPDQAG